MTHEQVPFHSPGLADAGGQIARLRHILALVEELAGGSGGAADALDQAARVSAAYARALPIDQARFDARASETVSWAGAGAQALLSLDERGLPGRAAARELAAALDRALDRLAGTVSP
jgi:ketosteroid isomerase-like protein